MPLGAARGPVIRRKAVAQSYFPNGVVGDGTNDWLNRTSVFTGAADSSQWTVAFALRLNAIDIYQTVFRGQLATNVRYFIRVEGNDNSVRVFARNTSATTICDFRSSIALTTGQWYAIAISFDLADTANRHLYIDDVDRLGTVTTYTNGSIGFSEGETIGIFAVPTNGVEMLNGELADLWTEFGRYVDLSVEANRRLFFNASNCLVDKGSDGSTPFGAAPTAYFGDDNDETNWELNNTGNGDMTVNGALGGSSEDPCGE